MFDEEWDTPIYLDQITVEKCSTVSLYKLCEDHNMRKKVQVDNNLLEMAVARSINEVNWLSPQYHCV